MSRQLTFGHTEIAFPLWPICQKFHRRYVQLDDDLEQRSSPSAPAELTKAYWDVIGERMETATIAIVFAATRAPSGSNRQPFRFLVLTDGPKAAEAKALVADAARRIWSTKAQHDGYGRGSGADDDSPKSRMASR